MIITHLIIIGALIYRVLPPVNQDMKKKLKIAHAVTMGIVFVLMVIALKVIITKF